MSTASSSTTSPTPHHSYLTLVPRGLEHYVCDQLWEIPQVQSVRRLPDPYSIDDHDNLERLYQATRAKDESKGRNQRRYQCLTKTASGTVGPIPLLTDGRHHVHMGYDNQQPTIARSGSTTTRATLEGSDTVRTCEAGLWHGIVALEIQTDPSIEAVQALGAATTRCVGPLLALVREFDCTEQNEDAVTLEQAVESLAPNFADGGTDPAMTTTYEQHFSAALKLWRLHVRHCWNQLRPESRSSSTDDEENQPLRYRFSFVRSGATQHHYTRQQLLSTTTLPLVPPVYQQQWTVDLCQYDLEIVLLQRSTHWIVALALRPYQRVGRDNRGVRSFAHNGLPPDITPPVLQSTRADVVRLKPPTARALLQIAQVKPGEVVYDPCCGLGTIPYEAALLGAVVAMGGDLILQARPQREDIRATVLEYQREVSNFAKSNKKRFQNADVVAMDASSMQLRSRCVDVVVSDLPFGQHCLSSASLDQLLPLLMTEIARVLRPNHGRMVLLCGSYVPILEAMQQVEGIWQLPCPSIFPVSIGGHVAWVVMCYRGPELVEQESDHRDKARKLTKKREMRERTESSLPSDVKRRRAQA